MRAFYITLSIFLALCVCGVFNYIGVNDFHSQMSGLLTRLSETPNTENAKILDEMSEYWENSQLFIGISVNYASIDALSNALDTAIASNKALDKGQFISSIAILENAIDNIRRLERISIKTIL